MPTMQAEEQALPVWMMCAGSLARHCNCALPCARLRPWGVRSYPAAHAHLQCTSRSAGTTCFVADLLATQDKLVVTLAASHKLWPVAHLAKPFASLTIDAD